MEIDRSAHQDKDKRYIERRDRRDGEKAQLQTTEAAYIEEG